MKEPPRRQESRLEKAGAAVRRRALTGWEASSVGFILVATIFSGAGVGYLLDRTFKTNWMVAVGVLAGAALGFREMFRLAQRLSRESIAEDESGQTAPVASPTSTRRSTSDTTTRRKPRFFAVPPPPGASFEGEQGSTPAPPDSEAGDAEEDLMERLLREEEEDRGQS